MTLTIPVLFMVVTILIFTVAMAWAIGHDQGANWEERARQKRDRRKVRHDELEYLENRVARLERNTYTNTTDTEENHA